jgi:hypothetical protein
MESTDVSLDTKALPSSDYSNQIDGFIDARSPDLPGLLSFCSLGLLGIFACSTISCILPVHASDPTWRLQFIKTLISNGSLAVIAIVLLELAVHLNPRLEPRSTIYRRLSISAAAIYLLLGPLHIGGLMQRNHDSTIEHGIEKINLHYSISDQKTPSSLIAPRQLSRDRSAGMANKYPLEEPQDTPGKGYKNQQNSRQPSAARPPEALLQTSEILINSTIYTAIFGLYSGVFARISELPFGVNQGWKALQVKLAQQRIDIRQYKDDQRRIAELKRYRRISEKITRNAANPYHSLYDDSNNA